MVVARTVMKVLRTWAWGAGSFQAGEAEDIVGRSDLGRAWRGSGELPSEQDAHPGAREHALLMPPSAALSSPIAQPSSPILTLLSTDTQPVTSESEATLELKGGKCREMEGRTTFRNPD